MLYNPKMKVWLPFPACHLPSLLLSGVSPSFLQAATLSHHQICVGNIPDRSRACRLVFLNNTSESKAVVFAWKTSNVKESGVSGSFSLLCSAQGTGGGSLLCHKKPCLSVFTQTPGKHPGNWILYQLLKGKGRGKRRQG